MKRITSVIKNDGDVLEQKGVNDGRERIVWKGKGRVEWEE